MSYVLQELCLEITNSCTMECRHCSTRSLRIGVGRPLHIPVFVAQSVISQFAGMGGRVLEISGGEPLLHPHLFEICQFARDLGLEIRLYTSGIAANLKTELRGISEEFMSKIQKIGVSKIIFNLEGANPKTHEKIMGVLGTHSLVIEGIKRAKKSGLWVGVHFVPMKPNVKELEDVASLCRRMWVDELALLRFVPQGRGKDNRIKLELDHQEFQNLLKTIVTLRKKTGALKIRAGCPMDFISLIDKTAEPHHCKAGITTCSVAPNGDVVPCPGFKNAKDFIAGNIYRNSLSEIWNTGFWSLRAFTPFDLSGPCSSCSDLETCRGRCAAQRLIANRSISVGPDPYCPKYRTARKTKFAVLSK